MTNKSHFTTTYLMQDSKGRLYIASYRPTDGYEGQRASDSYSLMQGMFIDNPSHDIVLGSVSCHLNTDSNSGIHTQKGIILQVVAKRQNIWDYSKQIGQRESEVVLFGDWNNLFTKYRNQK